MQLTIASGLTAAYTLSGGTLKLGATGIASGGGTETFTLSGGILAASATYVVSVPVVLGSSTNSTLASDGFTITFSGVISGSASLTKTTAGTVVLGSTSDSFTGGTTISAGTVSARQHRLSGHWRCD